MELEKTSSHLPSTALAATGTPACSTCVSACDKYHRPVVSMLPLDWACEQGGDCLRPPRLEHSDSASTRSREARTAPPPCWCQQRRTPCIHPVQPTSQDTIMFGLAALGRGAGVPCADGMSTASLPAGVCSAANQQSCSRCAHPTRAHALSRTGGLVEDYARRGTCACRPRHLAAAAVFGGGHRHAGPWTS